MQTVSFSQFFPVFPSIPFYQSSSYAHHQYISVIFRLAVLYTSRHSVYVSYFQFTILPVWQSCRHSVYVSYFQIGSFVYSQTLRTCQLFSVHQLCIQSDTQNLSVIFSSPVVYTVRHSELISYFQFTSCVYSQTLRTYQLFSVQ